jgi:hypothetical protein
MLAEAFLTYPIGGSSMARIAKTSLAFMALLPLLKNTVEKEFLWR